MGHFDPKLYHLSLTMHFIHTNPLNISLTKLKIILTLTMLTSVWECFDCVEWQKILVNQRNFDSDIVWA